MKVFKNKMPSFPYREQEEDLNTRSENAIKEITKKLAKKNGKHINPERTTGNKPGNN